jgi:hypothetical protein
MNTDYKITIWFAWGELKGERKKKEGPQYLQFKIDEIESIGISGRGGAEYARYVALSDKLE